MPPEIPEAPRRAEIPATAPMSTSAAIHTVHFPGEVSPLHQLRGVRCCPLRRMNSGGSDLSTPTGLLASSGPTLLPRIHVPDVTGREAPQRVRADCPSACDPTSTAFKIIPREARSRMAKEYDYKTSLLTGQSVRARAAYSEDTTRSDIILPRQRKVRRLRWLRSGRAKDTSKPEAGCRW